MSCALCGAEGALDRLSGVDLCGTCRSSDPTDALQALGFEVAWDTRMLWFSAGVGIPGAAPEFMLWCAPEMLHHKLMKLVKHEVEVGDPTFDDKVYVRTSDAERAARILASEGVQSALLGLLTGVRRDEPIASHVTLDGPSLTLRVRPLDGLSVERIAELKLETAALALQLRDASQS